MTSVSTTSDKINTHGGLGLVGKLLGRFCRLGELFPRDPARRSDHTPDAGILTSLIGLLAMGRTHFSDIELFRGDGAEGFRAGLGLDAVPGESTLRHGIEAIVGDNATMRRLQEANLALIRGTTASRRS